MSENNKSVGELLIALYSKDAQTRRDSVEALAQHIDDRVLLRLVEHLDDENKGVRDAISQILFEYCEDNPFITEPILRYIFVGSIETKNLASEIIVKIGRKSIPYMEHALTCDDRDVRKFIADTLGFIGHSDAIPFLVKAFDDEDPNVGFSSIEAVGSIGSDEGFKALKEVCESNAELRAMAIEALGKIGTKECLDVIKNYFTDEDPMVVYSCIDALSNIQIIESYNILNEVYDSLDEMSQENAVEALNTLVQHVDVDTVPGKYFEGLRSKFDHAASDEEKLHIMNVLSKVNHKNTIEFMLNVAADIEELQEHIFRSLCERNYNSESELTSLLNTAEGVAFEILISVISELGFSSALSELNTIYESSSENKKLNILEVLGTFEKTETSIALLTNALNDENTLLKAQAIKSLGMLQHIEQFDSLLEILNNTETEEIAFAVLESFVSMGGEKSIAFFQEMFASDDIDDKSMSLQALSALDESVTMKCILELISSGNDAQVLLALELIQENEINEFNTNLIQIYPKQDIDNRKLILKHVLKSEDVPDDFILQALSDEDKWVQISALETLETTSNNLLTILEKINVSTMDPFAVRSLFDHLQKIVDDDKVKHFLIENINRVDEEIQKTVIANTDGDFQSRLKKQLNVESN